MKTLRSEPLWYQSAVFYEAYVRSFYDSNADGYGDFKGLTEKLDYLEWLGIDCLWLLPFYQSPLRDGGYDISDFYSILPEYGNLNDFVEFLEEAHKRGIRVIADMVMNHTSDEHPWFQESRKPGSDKRDWYVWSETDNRYSDARIIFLDTEKSNWTWDDEAGAYYWHRFFSHQPDLNYDNPEVQEQMVAVLKFWLDLGLDGFRLDAVPYLFEREGTNCENLPETHDFLRRIRKEIDADYENIVLLAEANQWPSDVVEYFGHGDECHMCFNFPLMPRMFMAARRQVRYPIVEILEQTPPIPENCQWGIFLRNHDELTLEMVTDEERDYMWNEYAKDPRMKLNIGIRRRLAPHIEHRAAAGRRRTRDRLAAGSPLLTLTERALGELHLWKKANRLLERADVPLRTAEFFWLCFGTGLFLAFVAAVSGQPSIITLGGFALGASVPLGFVVVRAQRRLRAFDNQLPDLLLTLAASLKAGHSFKQGIQSIVDEGLPPASEELRRVLAEVGLGRPLEEALRDMSARVGSDNLDFVVTSVTIQGQVGGSLAGLFDMVAEAVRQRQQFARKIRGLTAMGRASAYVLVGLPFAMAGLLTVINREYMNVLWHTGAGHMLIYVGLTMMVFGSLLLKRIVSFRG